MKKLLFTFFALILCSATLLASNSKAPTIAHKTIAQLALKSSPVNELAIDANAKIATAHAESTSTNGKTDGSSTKVATYWRTYVPDAFGPITISVPTGYWIESAQLAFAAKNSAILCNTGGLELTADYSSNDLIPVNGQSKIIYTSSSGNDKSTGFIGFTDFIINYYQIPTSITLTSVAVNVGGNATVAASILPATASDSLTWTSSNPSVATVDNNGQVTGVAIGNTIITATGIDGKVAGKCMIAVLDGAQSIDTKDFYSKITATSTTKTTANDNISDENGIEWQYRRYRKCDATKFGDEQGVELSSETIGYLAYVNAQEGGVKSIAFQWRTVDAENKPLFMVDASGSSFSYDLIDLTKDAAFANNQYYSKELNYTSNVYLRVRNTNQTDNKGANSGVVFGPITITPYLLYTNKTVDVYNDGYINEDLIKNTTGEAVVYSLIGSGDSDKAEINSSTGAITIKAEGTVTVQASWNSGKVTTTYTATLHKSPAPTVSFTDGEAVTKSMNLETYTNALNWTSDPTKCGDVTYESDNEEIAKFEDETVNVLSIVGAGKVNITAHIAKGSEFAEKDLTYELTVEDPNEDAITEKFKAYTTSTWSDYTTPAADKTGDYFTWTAYLAQRRDYSSFPSGTASLRFDDSGNGYLVSKEAVEGGIKRVSFHWAKSTTTTPTFKVTVGDKEDNVQVGERVVSTYNHNFFAKSKQVLKIESNSAKTFYVGDIKITPYLLYTRKDTTISAVTYVGGTYSNDKLYNNTNDEGTISYSIEDAVSKAAIATIEDPNSDVVTIHGAGTVKVIASWNGVEMTSYNLTIEKATPTIENFYNKEYDIFGTYSQTAIYAKIGTTAIENPVFEYSVEDENIAYVDASGNVIIKATGQTNVTCTLKEGALYKSVVSEPKYLKVTEPANGCWKENFNHLRSNMAKYLADTTIYGRDSVLHWRIQNFRRNNNDLIKNAANENEQGMRLGGDKTNGISYLNTEDGGVKALFFNWRITGSGTVENVYFNINAKGLAEPIQEHFTSVAAGASYSYSYAKELNLDQNDSISISITNQNTEGVVFGPVTIKPYLLYTLKADTIDYADNGNYTNSNLINNTDVVIEAGQEAIEFSALPESVATINEEGNVTILTPGDVTITAKWGEVTTSYSLHINRLDLDPATLTFQIADNPVEKDMNAEPFDNKLTVPTGAGTVTYTSNKENVAKVDLNSGLVTIVGAGNATITAHVAAGTLYNATSKTYTVSVSEPIGEKRIFEAFTDSLWNIDAPSIGGDLGRWNSYKSRRKTTDIMADGQPAIFFLGDVQSYLETQKELEGGIKRMSFVWYRAYLGKDDPHPADSIHNFSIIMDDVVKDTIDAGKEGWSQYRTYNHNFGVMKNVKLKLENTSLGATKIDTIRIVPYIYYTTKVKEYQYEKGLEISNFGGFINNTTEFEEGVLTYESSNTSVATVIESGPGAGVVTAQGPGEATITALWKPSAASEDFVTATYQVILHDKQDRKAKFTDGEKIVARGETPVNALQYDESGGDDPATPVITYYSDNTQVATIGEGNVVQAIAPGEATIKAVIQETAKFRADSCTYKLTVTYNLAEGRYILQTLDSCKTDRKATGSVNVKGDNEYYSWILTNYQRQSDKDMVDGKQGVRIYYSGSIAMTGEPEGGIKEVVFDWRCGDGLRQLFTVNAGSVPHEYTHVAYDKPAPTKIPYAHEFNVKRNAVLSIVMDEQKDPQQAYPIVGPIKIVPYLFYKTKNVEINANDPAIVEADYTYTNKDTIDNRGGEGTIVYLIENAEANANIATINASTGAVSIAGEGTVKVIAKWKTSELDSVTTSYMLKINLEDAGLDFTEKTPVVLLGTGSYTQTASKSTTAAVKYEFEEGYDSGTATINETTGEVTFKGQTGELHILASVPVALPCNLDSARYVLTVNNKPTPTVVFDPKTVDMNAEAFTPEAKTIPSSGMGTASYVSSNLEVAKIEEGKVTIVGEGTSTISVHFEEGDEWGEADVDFLLTVTDVLDEDSIKESFANDADWQKACTTVIDVDGLFGWKTYLTRHRSSGDSPDRLASGEQATWFNNSGNAYLKSANAIEGGIKRVAFNWKKETVTANVPSLTVKVDNEPLVVDATDRTGVDQRFNHNYFVKKNVALEIDNNTASLLRVGAIKITPYLYYETKKCTLDLKVKENFKNEDLIDNRDDKATSSISYSIVAGNEGSIAEIAEDGTVTATAGGEITVQAQWSTNTSVTTTYTLTILPSKTTINLMRNDGTEDKDVIENNIGEVMPEFTLPTRTDYRFNAYFIDQACTAKRFTITTLTYTGWVSNITYNKVNYTGEDRIWTYSGNDAVTLYADWKPERTITLDNQEADEAGTEEVVTAYCPNNHLVNLMDPITIPQKENHIFRGYFTEEEGAGTQLIDANGAFIANVTGYTDTEKNYKKWKKDADITLYAKWEKAIEMKDNEDNETKLTPLVESGESITFYLTRSFTAGEYNTICLPFNVNKETMADKFGTYELATLDSEKSASLDDAGKNLSIYIVAEDSIKAGLPYLIKLATPVSNPSFENVVVKCAKGDSISSADDESKQVRFCGLLSPKLVPANKSVLFVVKNDKLAWNATGEAKNMNGMRAYFHVNGIGNVTSVSPRLVLRQPTTPTELGNVNENVNVNCKVLINDQIYIIRNGVYYNVSGQIVR